MHQRVLDLPAERLLQLRDQVRYLLKASEYQDDDLALIKHQILKSCNKADVKEKHF